MWWCCNRMISDIFDETKSSLTKNDYSIEISVVQFLLAITSQWTYWCMNGHISRHTLVCNNPKPNTLLSWRRRRFTLTINEVRSSGMAIGSNLLITLLILSRSPLLSEMIALWLSLVGRSYLLPLDSLLVASKMPDKIMLSVSDLVEQIIFNRPVPGWAWKCPTAFVVLGVQYKGQSLPHPAIKAHPPSFRSCHSPRSKYISRQIPSLL